MRISHGQSASVFKDLRAGLTGSVILPQEEGYDQARELWNGKVNKYPAAIVRCADAQDVVQAVRWAREHGLALSVRGGGYDVAGRALCEGEW